MKIDPNIKEDLKRYLEQKIKEEKKQVTIISAYKLSDKEINALYNNFPFLRNSNPKFKIDMNLIAGVIIKIGTKIIDLSINSQLHNLRNIAYEINR